MSKRLLLPISLALNLALGCWAVAVWRRPPAGGPVAPAPVSAPVAPASQVPSVKAASPEVVYRTNRLHWGMLEAEDYAQYVANLRSVGCPDKTIRDIVVADVEAAYKLKVARVNHPAPFWLTADDRLAYERAELAERRQLHDERTALLAQLGIDNPVAPDDDAEDLVSCAVMFFMLGPMPLETARSAFGELMRTEPLVDRAREGTAGLAEEEAATAAAREEAFRRVMQVLTPAQFQEFTTRLAGMHLRDDIPGPTTAQELRGLAEILLQVVKTPRLVPLLDGMAEIDEATEAELEGRFRKFLGEARYAQLREEGE